MCWYREHKLSEAKTRVGYKGTVKLDLCTEHKNILTENKITTFAGYNEFVLKLFSEQKVK